MRGNNMYVDNLSEEDLAKVFTDFVFCNTQVADYYGETATMDDVFYATMLDVVTANLRRIARNHKLLARPEAEVDAAVEAMYPSRAMEFMRYAAAFADYEARLPGPLALRLNRPRTGRRFSLTEPFGKAASGSGGSTTRPCAASSRMSTIGPTPCSASASSRGLPMPVDVRKGVTDFPKIIESLDKTRLSSKSLDGAGLL